MNITRTYADNTKEHYRTFVYEETPMVCVLFWRILYYHPQGSKFEVEYLLALTECRNSIGRTLLLKYDFGQIVCTFHSTEWENMVANL